MIIINIREIAQLAGVSVATVSRTLGKAMGEFRRVSTDFQRTLNAEVAREEEEEMPELIDSDSLPGAQGGYGFAESTATPVPQATLPPSNP